MEKTTNGAKNILVPTDLTVTCENAFEHAVKLANNNSKAVIYLLHVIEDKVNLFPGDPWVEYAKAEERQETLSLLKKYITIKNAKNVVPLVREGDLFETINSVAHEIKADTVILGTHGKIGMQKLFGSYALKVIDHTDIPVLVIQDKPVDSVEKSIIFPVSLHDEERQKAKIAAKYSHEYGAKVHVVIENPKSESEKVRADSLKRQIKTYFDKMNINYSIRVSSYRDKAFENDVEDYAKFIHADFIIILTDPSHHYFIGGGKEESYIFNKSHVPVMCTTARKFKTVGSDSAFSGAYY